MCKLQSEIQCINIGDLKIRPLHVKGGVGGGGWNRRERGRVEESKNAASGKGEGGMFH